jgi:hypothetical protein
VQLRENGSLTCQTTCLLHQENSSLNALQLIARLTGSGTRCGSALCVITASAPYVMNTFQGVRMSKSPGRWHRQYIPGMTSTHICTS